MIYLPSKPLTLLILLTLTVSCGSTEETTRTEWEQVASLLPERPGTNIIVISFDALRADALGLYGYSKPTTPRIDQFSESTLVFDRAYTVAPVTPTSFASAFTGLLPSRVFHAWDLVWTDTLASRFSSAGYRTAGFMNNLQLSTQRHFDTGFDHYTVYRSQADDQVIDDSLDWLEAEQGNKVFAWIHFLSPHAPYDRRDLATHLYDPDYQGEFEKTTRGTFDTEDPREIERIRSLYDGEVLYADTLFGRLLHGLEVQGYLENSIIVLTSDHGEEFKEHGGFQHDRLTEEHVQIPLLLYHPDVRTGSRTTILASNLDLFPTLLSLAAIPNEAVLEGHDLRSLQAAPSRVAAVSMTGGRNRWLSLRKGDLKLILTCMPEQSAELFDLDTDPLETRNLATELGQELRSLLKELDLVMGGDACQLMQAAVRGATPERGLSQETIEGLKALGYLGGN